MKRIIVMAAMFLSLAPMAFAGVVEGWTSVQNGTNTGTYMDNNGSKIDFAVDAGPIGRSKSPQGHFQPCVGRLLRHLAQPIG